MGASAPVSCSFSWWLLAFLDLGPHHLSLCLCGHIASSSVCIQSLPLPCKDGCDWIKVRPGNPGYPSFIQNLSFICKDPSL